MEQTFDLVVIGTGSAGAATAQACREQNWEVAIVDSREYGGTCALRGCDPKKVLVGAAELVDRTERMIGKGLQDSVRINWPDLMAFKHTFTDYIPGAHEKKLKDAGIHTFHGHAKFVSEDTIDVDGHRLTGKHILIATGAKPAPLSVEGEQYLANSDHFLNLEQLPSPLVFVGGGYISFEFAHIAARAGAEVHILHKDEQPLKGFDPELVQELVQRSREIGIHIHLNTSLQSIEQLEGEVAADSQPSGAEQLTKGTANQARYMIRANQQDGEQGNQELRLECGLVVHGAGRVPNIMDIQLDQGKVEFGKKGVHVNEYMQSVSNPRVYAAGDCTDSPGLPLTPLASLESQVATHNLLHGNTRKPDYRAMPSIAFTIPKLGAIGMTEEEARKLGDRVTINTFDTSTWYTYKRTNEQTAMAKIIIDTSSRQILGAHLLSGEADEMLNYFAIAIRLHLTIDQMREVLYAYPTPASDLSYMLKI
ncbi:dihydrolipoyl dehydrogenase family protein [Paenibacillus bovis]|uniref:Pyridine nucleotide-disulfide oxidoreductase n=1 Tax=Paenibacillus bovis TaxID=1616788 RepID=A0A172ZCU7_9BACL|nr:NAD(P)/FAD-dependent oxidoreductase [Paenibacillus bovis]ANF95481.1 pyridine nucleotide-disulfide oxidoreductase [Paenibacillus bovis]